MLQYITVIEEDNTKIPTTQSAVARYCLGLVEVVLGLIPKMLTPRDPEDLHQFRVHLRKLRSILLTYDVLFPKKELNFFIRRIEELAQATNIARDLDVHQELLDHEINSVSPAYRIGLRILRNKWKVERHNIQMQIHEIITLRQRDGFFNALVNWLNSYTNEPVELSTPEIPTEIIDTPESNNTTEAEQDTQDQNTTEAHQPPTEEPHG